MKYYFVYYMFLIKLCEINFVYKAMYIIKILVLFRTTKCLKERYKHQQSNVIRKVNKVKERGQNIEHMRVCILTRKQAHVLKSRHFYYIKVGTKNMCLKQAQKQAQLFLPNTLYSILQELGEQLAHRIIPIVLCFLFKYIFIACTLQQKLII